MRVDSQQIVRLRGSTSKKTKQKQEAKKLAIVQDTELIMWTGGKRKESKPNRILKFLIDETDVHILIRVCNCEIINGFGTNNDNNNRI